jgi:hypothetical protein
MEQVWILAALCNDFVLTGIPLLTRTSLIAPSIGAFDHAVRAANV